MKRLEMKTLNMISSKLAYFYLRKALGRQKEKQAVVLKSLNPSIKKSELKQFEGIFLQNLMNDSFTLSWKKPLICKILLKKFS